MNPVAGVAARYRLHVLLAAVVLGLALSPAPRIVVAFVGIGYGITLMLIYRRLTMSVSCLLLVAVGGLTGDTRLIQIDRSALAAQVGSAITLHGFVTDPPVVRGRDTVARVRVSVGRAAGELIEVRSAVSVQWPPATIGEEVALSGLLVGADDGASVDLPGAREADGRVRKSGEFDYGTFLRRAGVHVVLRTSSVALTGRGRTGLSGWLDEVRRRSDRGLVAGVPDQPGALLRGMVLGGDELLSPVARDEFRASGLAHLVAVSGQNVLLLIILIRWVLALAGAPYRVQIWTCVAAIAMYVPLCGGGASVLRAGVMGIAALAAVLATRPVSRAWTLLLAALVLLVFNPRASGDVGAQLSFAAVVGIMVMAGPLRDRLSRWRLARPVAEAIAVTASATLATAPVMAFSFGAVSASGLIANLLVAPVVGPIVWLGTLSAIAAQWSPAVAGGFNQLSVFGLAFMLQIAHAASVVPGAVVRLPQGDWRWLAGLSTVPVGIGLWMHRPAAALRVQLMARARQLPPVAVPAGGVALVGLVVALLMANAQLRRVPVPSALRPGGAGIVFLNAGQGDSILVRGREGCTALFDAGRPEAKIADQLEKFGVNRLNLLVATHQSADHHGGMVDVLNRISVDRFMDGGGPTADKTFIALRGEIMRRRIPAVEAETGQLWTCGDLRIEVLSPARRAPGSAIPADSNPFAVVAHVKIGELDLLTSGDAESGALLPLPLPDVDVLKLPHHGSRDPGLAAVLERTTPVVAAITVGTNTYGHPAPETLSTLTSVPVVARTDRDGWISVGPAPRGKTTPTVAREFPGSD